MLGDEIRAVINVELLGYAADDPLRIGFTPDSVAKGERGVEGAGCVKADEVLEKQYHLVNSVYCIGPQTAMFIVVLTQGFSLFDDPRKFACYCGIAPFPNTSGSTLKGRTKVSHMANKRIKTLLTMCALNTIKKDNEFKRYYDRKIKEGKHHSAVLNVLRNKLVSRAFAAVNKNRPYCKDIDLAA